MAAATTIHAACDLGSLAVPIPESIAEAVAAAKTHFLADELQSKPLGFYTWTPELTAIFRQDRVLQRPLKPEVAEALANAMAQTPTAALTYKTTLQLAARLTNPAKEQASVTRGKAFPSSHPRALPMRSVCSRAPL